MAFVESQAGCPIPGKRAIQTVKAVKEGVAIDDLKAARGCQTKVGGAGRAPGWLLYSRPSRREMACRKMFFRGQTMNQLPSFFEWHGEMKSDFLS